jgi:hypothetical protein
VDATASYNVAKPSNTALAGIFLADQHRQRSVCCSMCRLPVFDQNAASETLALRDRALSDLENGRRSVS